MRSQLLLLAGIIFLLYSCQQISEDAPEQFETEVDEVVNIIAQNFLSVTIIGGDEERAFSSGRILGEEDNSLSKSPQNEELPPNLLISCIRGLHLEQSQLQDFRRLMFSFDNCKSDVMNSFRGEIIKVIYSLEEKRSELIEQVRSDEISREEFKVKIEELRKKYSIIIEEVKRKHKEDLKPCLKKMVSGIQTTLGREDWLDFRKCISKS